MSIKEHHHIDVYGEICPASSATVIGAGLVTVTMGSATVGMAFVLIGIAVGLAGPLIKSLHARKVVRSNYSSGRG